MHVHALAALLLGLPALAAAPAPELPADHLEGMLAGRPPWRRLFLDAMVVEESSGLARVFHQAAKYPRNPVMPCDKPWEGWGPYIYGTVLWDGAKLRMWYQAIAAEPGIISRALYAESSDGLSWTRPELGIVEYKGSKTNNILAERICSIPSVIELPNAGSPDRRWAVYSFGSDPGAHVAFSGDGLHWGWKADPACEKLFVTSDVINVFYDPYKSRYTATYKMHSRRHRSAGLAVSDDGITWRKPLEPPVFASDDLDPDATQVYGMPVFPYQGLYVGLPWIYHARYMKYGEYSPNRMYEAQEGSPRTVDVQLAWSWNLVNWTRTPERKPFIPLGPPGSFDSEMIYTARAPVIVGDKLYFYYGGFDRVHDDYDGIKAAIGLATLRIDGFCSMRAGQKEGWLVSRREVFRRPRVMINARTASDGYVAAEIIDRNNKVIPGFGRADCVAFAGDSIRHTLEWKAKSFPKQWLEPDKKIRFFLKDADLYSYLPAEIDAKLDPATPQE